MQDLKGALFSAIMPLVTIGIPTYNRAQWLRRAIDSALNQTYSEIEVVVSDNASTDTTAEICNNFSHLQNFRYFRHPRNLGPRVNFEFVLSQAHGQYFMWLGDDDWIDLNYVETCIKEFIRDDSLSLVSGKPYYYKGSVFAYEGKVFNLESRSPLLRVLKYYWLVKDNGMFYGIYKTSQIKKVPIPKAMGADWFMLARLLYLGRGRMLTTVGVHRETGGATISFINIAKTSGLPVWHGVFPFTFIAFGGAKATEDFELEPSSLASVRRPLLAMMVFIILFLKGILHAIKRLLLPAVRVYRNWNRQRGIKFQS